MTESLENYILQRSQQLGLTQQELCRRAGISRQTLHSMTRAADKLPSLQTTMAVAGALQVHPIRLLQILCDENLRLWAPTTRVKRSRYPQDASAFVRDVTLPDGTPILPGQTLAKTWELQNVGSVAWQGRYLQCMDSEIVVHSRDGSTLELAQNLRPALDRVPMPDTLPGASAQVSVTFTAPDSPGTVLSYWKMVFDDGGVCFPRSRGVWVKLLVCALDAAEGEGA